MRPIDADAMMKRLKAWDTNDVMDKALYNFALNRVLEAPTIEPERKPEWISGDTPPDESGLYLVTEKWGGDLEVTTRYFNKRRDGGSFWSGYPYQGVEAWMPLPEPYKERREE